MGPDVTAAHVSFSMMPPPPPTLVPGHSSSLCQAVKGKECVRETKLKRTHSAHAEAATHTSTR